MPNRHFPRTTQWGPWVGNGPQVRVNGSIVLVTAGVSDGVLRRVAISACHINNCEISGRFPKPQADSPKEYDSNNLATQPNSRATPSATGAQENDDIDPCLATVVDAWSTLPESVKAAVMALVKADTVDD